MASERTTPGPWWEPTWRRLIGSTVVLFLVILAFLVGRVRSGADPALAGSTSSRPAQQAPAVNGTGGGAVPPSAGVDPNDPFADPQGQVDPQGRVAPQGQVDPSTGAGTDNFGNAIPDGSGSAPQSAAPQSAAPQSVDPPSTHVS
jgi:hypothetical protein